MSTEGATRGDFDSHTCYGYTSTLTSKSKLKPVCSGSCDPLTGASMGMRLQLSRLDCSLLKGNDIYVSSLSHPGWSNLQEKVGRRFPNL